MNDETLFSLGTAEISLKMLSQSSDWADQVIRKYENFSSPMVTRTCNASDAQGALSSLDSKVRSILFGLVAMYMSCIECMHC